MDVKYVESDNYTHFLSRLKTIIKTHKVIDIKYSTVVLPDKRILRSALVLYDE